MKGYSIWIVLLIPAIFIAWLLISSIKENQNTLQEQCIRSLHLTESNLQKSWDNEKIQYGKKLDHYFAQFKKDATQSENSHIRDSIQINQLWNLLYNNNGFKKNKDGSLKIASKIHDNSNKKNDTTVIKKDSIISEYAHKLKLDKLGFGQDRLKKLFPKHDISKLSNSGKIHISFAKSFKDLFEKNTSSEFFDFVLLSKKIDSSKADVVYRSDNLSLNNIDTTFTLNAKRKAGVIEKDISISNKVYKV